MMTKAAKSKGFGLSELDATPEGELKGLRVRNISANALVIAGNGQYDMALGPFEETIVAAQDWRQNRFFREIVAQKKVQLALADVYDSPRQLPNLDAAPENALPEKAFDRSYVRHILITTDENEALEMLREEPVSEGGVIDEKFLKGRMTRILRCVEWAEPQVQNRKKILAAAKEQISKIRAL